MTTQPQLVTSRIKTDFENLRAAASALGVEAEKAAVAFQAFGKAAKVLEEETRALKKLVARSRRPWWHPGRW